MKYEVLWSAAAEQALASLWLRRDLRSKVSSAAREIDRLLATEPTTAGESREFTIRILFELPLAVSFDVDRDERRVFVWRLWFVQRRDRPKS